MSNFPLVLSMNPGRCGTRFLYNSFRETYPKLKEDGHLYHESLEVDECMPREFFRPYETERQEALLELTPIRRQINRWKEQIKRAPVFEFGWTLSHLAPLMKSQFGSRLRIVHMYRHPVIYAGSRASMGSYAGRYEDANMYELSPHDDHIQNRQFRERWDSMTPFERCLFLWLEYYEMGIEFRKKNPDLQTLVFRSEHLFQQPEETMTKIASLGELDSRAVELNVKKNPITNSHRERFPLGDEWKRYTRHPEILDTGEDLGYSMDEEALEDKMERYQLPDKWSSRIRHYANYWTLRRRLKEWIDSLGFGGPG